MADSSMVCQHYPPRLAKFFTEVVSLCMAKFDELSALGVEAFVRKHDPYWDVPLVESLPSPVIELPKLGVSEEQERYGATDLFGNPLQMDLFGNVINDKRGKKKR